ncbi:hypothetical protein AAG570_003635 [Ranatra chinensis]|uniref:Uncharacterized protein n=1 Tax=Ranatra chinensis TaxID=642074 RepID=A0ABD0Y498_9HEMI
MASKRRNMSYQNKKQETAEIGDIESVRTYFFPSEAGRGQLGRRQSGGLDSWTQMELSRRAACFLEADSIHPLLRVLVVILTAPPPSPPQHPQPRLYPLRFQPPRVLGRHLIERSHPLVTLPYGEYRKKGHYSTRRTRGQRLLSRHGGFKRWEEEDREDTRELGVPGCIEDSTKGLGLEGFDSVNIRLSGRAPQLYTVCPVLIDLPTPVRVESRGQFRTALVWIKVQSGCYWEEAEAKRFSAVSSGSLVSQDSTTQAKRRTFTALLVYETNPDKTADSEKNHSSPRLPFVEEILI